MAEQTPIRGVEILGTGSALPHRILTNDQLIAETGIDSSNEWIAQRTGILSRHWVSPGENTLTLSVEAARQALEAASLPTPYRVDRTILATTTSYLQVPGTHPDIIETLGIKNGASRKETSSKEVNTACTGFVTAMIDGFRGFATDGDEVNLVIGTDVLSPISGKTDREIVILFGDGSGAAVLGRSDRTDAGLYGWYEMTDGSAREALWCEYGEDGYINMDGREVFRRATRVMAEAGKVALQRSGLKIEEIDLVIPHQANVRIIEYAAGKLGVGMEKVVVTLDHHGNTSSGSIPLATDEAVRAGRLEKGMNYMMVGFGAGMTAAALVGKW